jgi:hypothetical protein
LVGANCLSPKNFSSDKIQSQPSQPSPKSPPSLIPTLEQCKSYFLEKESTALEAERFFNYFESNGWLVGGKAKMKDWRAAARNWMLNASRFAKPDLTASRLHVEQNKRYDIPL